MFLTREQGFTLPEVLVTIMMMVMVLFALYSIFDMGIRVFAFGNDKLEATENARLGLEKMSRETRAAYIVDQSNSKNYRFFSASNATWTNNIPANAPPSATLSSSQITFGNDLNGNGKVECGSPCEYITYKLAASNNLADSCTVAPCTLVRNNTVIGTSSNTGNQPVAENVSSPSGLTFTPLTASGGVPTNEAEIDVIRVRLEISVPGDPPRTQTLTTMVNLRNGAQ